MKIFLTLLLCLFFGSSVFGQAVEIENKAEIAVEEISLRRSNGAGKVGETTEIFKTNDFPIRCSIKLATAKSVTVKMIFVAVKTDDLKPETKVVTVAYKTDAGEDAVTFNASPKTVWAAGDYRVDIFLDGKLAGSKTFEIQKSQTEKLERKPKLSKSRTRPKVVRMANRN